MESKKGQVIGVVGPTCSGKTTVVKRILSTRLAGIGTRLVTYTTREPRMGEVNGVDYHFVPLERFKLMEESNGELYEVSSTSGCSYGSSKKDLDKLTQKYPFVFAVLDLNGIKKLLEVERGAWIIGINASPEMLKRRLAGRLWKSHETLVQRTWEACRGHWLLANIGDCHLNNIHYVFNNEDGQLRETVDKIMTQIEKWGHCAPTTRHYSK